MNIQISDISLPELSTQNIRSILKSSNMPVRIPEGGGTDFNCWGFTAYYHRWIDRAYWMDRIEMETRLKVSTHPIKQAEVKAGDIAIFTKYDYLSHTAIVLDNGSIVYHKPGGHRLCIDSLNAVSMSYGYVTYARSKTESQKEFDNLLECVRLCV